MKTTSSMTPGGWRHNLAILALALLIVLGAVFGLALPCGGKQLPGWPDIPQGFRSSLAEVNLKAQPSGQLVMQSSAQVIDTDGNSWKVPVYKHPQGIDPQPLMLGLKGNPINSVIAPGTPLYLRLSNGRKISAPAHPLRSSLDWKANAFDVQYDLSTLWTAMNQSDGLTLSLLTGANRPIEIPITSRLLQEWHMVASCQALLCVAL